VKELLAVCYDEAKLVATLRNKKFAHIPTHDAELTNDLALTAVVSVLSRPGQVTLMGKNYDSGKKASFRTYIHTALRNKLIDYARKSDALDQPRKRPASTLSAFRNALTDNEALFGEAPEFDPATMQILDQLTRHLSPAEAEVFRHVFLLEGIDKLSGSDALAIDPMLEAIEAINTERQQANVSYLAMTSAEFTALKESAQNKLAALYPEHGLTQAQQRDYTAAEKAALREAAKTKLNDKEREVFECRLNGMTGAEGLAHLNATHPQKCAPNGVMKNYMSESDYKRKLHSARERIAPLFPGVDL
jgi:DNA-directed RNA polymerase specialized sigma24 family protein